MLAKVLAVLAFVSTLAPCGFSQQANVSPSSLNFTAQVVSPVSVGSQAKTLTVTNTGAVDLVVSSVTASGGYMAAHK